MTKKEALYWKNFILKVIEERLPLINPSTEDAIAISEFASQHMATITGQQMLPQSVFRTFLELFAKIPAIQAEIEQAQEDINEWLRNLPQECTEAEIYAMWDEVSPTPVLMLDEGGYILVPDSVERDAEGFMVLPASSFDEEGFIEVLNQLND